MYILIVDDHEATCEVLRSYLINMLHKDAKCACTKEGAIEEIKKRTPDIIFLDYILGPDTANDIIKLCKQLNFTCRVVLMSAHAKIEQIAKHLGLKYLIKKPFNLEQIDELIESIEK